MKQRASLDHEVDRVRQQVARAVDGDKPVIAGPFTGEVGFELLYWIPMLRWILREFPALRGRLVVVSRGGVQSWLTDFDAAYVDILSLFSTEDFARHRALADKQREVRAFDDAVVVAVKERLGLRDAAVLHPSLLYQAYYRYMKINPLAYQRALQAGAGGIVEGLTSVYAPIAPPVRSALPLDLPDDYVAVRFYSRDSFPATAEGAAFASAVISSLSKTTNVVLIGTGFALDEHRDVQGEIPGVLRVDHLMTPENNLAVQTAIVANASAFVGTYGGFSYLAPFVGVPSVSFSLLPEKTQPWHRALAARCSPGPSGATSSPCATPTWRSSSSSRGDSTARPRAAYSMSGGVRGLDTSGAA